LPDLGRVYKGTVLALVLSAALVATPGAIAIPITPFTPQPVLVQVPVGPNPVQAALSPDAKQIWVTDASSDQVYIIDAGSLRVIQIIHLPTTPYGIAISPNGSDAWVSGRNPNVALELSTSSYSTVAVVAIPVSNAYPYMIAISPNGTEIWVSDYFANVTIINARTATIMAELLVLPQDSSGGATAMTFSPDGRVVYLGFTGLPISSDVLVAYNATTRAIIWSSNVQCAGSIAGIIESPDGKRVYVLNDSTPGAEFNVLGANAGDILARVPMPTIRVEDFSTLGFMYGGAAVWFAGSQPGNDAVLVGIGTTSYSVGVVDYDAAVNGSTSLIVAQNNATAYALGDGGSPYLLAWSNLPYPEVSCFLTDITSKICSPRNDPRPLAPAVTLDDPAANSYSTGSSASCLNPPLGEALIILAVVVISIAVAAVVIVSRRDGTTRVRGGRISL
jgi:YVTN family beta-propeller protein